MPLLHIALQDGFIGDTVVVFVNGKEEYRKSPVNTRFQIGLADTFELNVAAGTIHVKVSLPLKNVSESSDLQVSADIYFGVSLSAEGKLICDTSDRPFGYL